MGVVKQIEMLTRALKRAPLEKLKGIFNPFRGIGIERIEHHTVEAAGAAGLTRVLHQIDLCRMNDALLFALINAGSRTAKALTLSVADFQENKGLTIKRNAIDLAAAHSVIAFEDSQTGAFDQRSGQRFRRIACELFVGAHVILRFQFYFKQF